MIDAAAPDARTTAIAVVWALLTDDDAGAEAASVCATPGLWERSLVSGTEDTDVAAATVACLEIAAGALEPRHPDLATACREWAATRPSIIDDSVDHLVTVRIEP